MALSHRSGPAPPSPASSTTSSLRPPHPAPPSTHSHSHRPKPTTLQRAEARLGVTTDYKDLSLHSAAAKGNLGLVKYALMHGQPVNSVRNGVLPLHAGASSGNVEVVRMLIEHGADVNAPRLSRRYSSDRSKGSGVAVGTAGSTPLHFAAANGHTTIIKLLLSYGAKTNAVEKNGLMPEAIALQKGYATAAGILRAWADDEADAASSSGTSLASGASKHRRLHPQRSFDALALKISHHAPSAHLHLPNSSSSLSLAILPTSAPSSSAAFGRRLSTSTHLLEPSHRRPSLPSVFEKAAHPAATLKQALGLSSLRRGSEGQHGGSSASVSGGSSRTSVAASGFWGKTAAEYQQELEEDSSGSDEFSRAPATAPPTQTAFAPADLEPRSTTVSRTASIGSAKSANFYRPRQSSQLSGRPATSWDVSGGGNPRVFLDDDEDDEAEQAGAGATREAQRLRHRHVGTEGGLPPPRGAPSTSPSTLRAPVSPLSAHAHSVTKQRRSSTASSAFSLNTAASRGTSQSATPERRSPLRESDVDEELGGASRNGDSTNDETIKASRRKSAPADETIRATRRLRTDSVDSTSSSFSRRTGASLSQAQHLQAPPPTPPLLKPNSLFPVNHLSSDLLPPRQFETRSSRSNSTGTDGKFSSSSPASSYSGPGTLSTYAPSNSTVATSVGPSSPNPAGARQPALSPLYEHHGATAKSDVSSTNTSTIGVTTSEQARRNVLKVEQKLRAFGAGGDMTLSQQLAAYGQSLSVERQLRAQEASPGGSKYVWETLGKDGKRVVTPSSDLGSKGPAIPQPARLAKHSDDSTMSWRAIPSHDRLGPPPATGRRSVSPAHSHPSVPPTPSPRRPTKDATSGPPSTASAPSRASSPTSTSGSSAVYPGPGGVSYVEVTPATPSPKARPSPRRASRSDRTHSQKGGSAGTADQVLIDAAEQARILAAIPTAQITVAKKKGGFTRRLLSSVKGHAA